MVKTARNSALHIVGSPQSPPELVLPVDVSGYIPEHVEARLSKAQGLALRRVFDALNGQARKLANGRYIQSNADALRWLLEDVQERFPQGR